MGSGGIREAGGRLEAAPRRQGVTWWVLSQVHLQDVLPSKNPWVLDLVSGRCYVTHCKASIKPHSLPGLFLLILSSGIYTESGEWTEAHAISAPICHSCLSGPLCGAYKEPRRVNHGVILCVGSLIPTSQIKTLRLCKVHLGSFPHPTPN